MTATPPDPAGHREARWRLIRDVLVFQAKMVLEATRDVALPLATAGAGLLGLLGWGGRHPEDLFHRVLRLGARFDLWLDLYAPVGEAGRAETAAPGGIDRWFGELESLLVEQHRRGQLTRSAKDAIDGWLDRLESAPRPAAGRPGGAGDRQRGGNGG